MNFSDVSVESMVKVGVEPFLREYGKMNEMIATKNLRSIKYCFEPWIFVKVI